MLSFFYQFLRKNLLSLLQQKNLFIGIIAFVLLSCGGWYFMYFSELNKSLDKMNTSYNQLKNEKNKYSQIHTKFPAIEKEWKE